MQDRSIIDANKQIIQERNREKKGTEERWCDMARNCSPTPGLTCFLCFCAVSPNILAHCKLHFSSNLTLKVSINRDDCIEKALLQKAPRTLNFGFKSILYALRPFCGEGCKGQGSSSPHAKLSPKLNPTLGHPSHLHLYTAYIVYFCTSPNVNPVLSFILISLTLYSL